MKRDEKIAIHGFFGVFVLIVIVGAMLFLNSGKRSKSVKNSRNTVIKSRIEKGTMSIWNADKCEIFYYEKKIKGDN